MSDIFKSAFGYFNSSPGQPVNNEMVGQILEINNCKLRVKRVIAEGGFAFVFVAQDTDSGKDYALKRLMAADEEARQTVIQEINLLKKLAGHPHIIQFIAASYLDKGLSGHGMSEYLILTELCEGGSLVESLQRRGTPYPPDVVCRIMWQTCKAVQHMHSQVPPIVHRDLKIENLLFSAEGKIKLCDFGSATTQIFQPDHSWNAQQRSMLEDKIGSCTTPMYRAPEMIDTWDNHEIGLASDIWALGCLLYVLCYTRHPFEDSAKLRIINANYTLPTTDLKYRAFHSIISGCLVAQPSKRLTISDILERLAAIAESNNFSLSDPIPIEKPSTPPANLGPAPNIEPPVSPVHQPRPPRPEQPVAPRMASPAHRNPSANLASGGLFSSIKGGAGSFLKNLKDTSSKVVQSVQQTMVRTEEMAASYITSRICVINYAEGPESLHDLRFIIEARQKLSSCAIYNLTSTQFPGHRFPNATVVEGGWSKKCPSLQALYTLCEHIHHFLTSDAKHVCIITCNDGKCNSAMLVCGYLLFVGFVSRPQDAMQMYAVKRTPPTLQPSHIRYLEYFSQVLSYPQSTFECNKLKLVTIVLQPVPLFNKIRDGCRPFLEVYVGEDKVFTSIDDYERINVFSVSHAKVVLPIGCTVSGDVTICVYHARQLLGRITPIKMLQLQFNTAFTQGNTLHFTKCELDDIPEGGDHFQDRLSVMLNCECKNETITIQSPWAKHCFTSPNILFTSKLEADETIETFVPKNVDRRAPPPARPAPPRPTTSPMHIPGRAEPTNISSSGPGEHVLLNEADAGADLIETVDLLNLGEPGPQPALATSTNFPPSSSTSLFDDFITSGSTTKPMPSTDNLLGDWSSSTPQAPNVGPSFGAFPASNNINIPNLNIPPPNNLGPGLNKNNSVGNLKNFSNIQRNVSYPNLKSTDPFDELISNASPKSVSTANSPAKSPNEGPNYNRSNFEAAKPPPAAQPAPAGKKSEDVFGELLGSQGYSFTSKKDTGPRTMNDMRREEVAKVTDPDKLLILDWTEGKKNNIRALLTTLHTIVWPEAKWSQCYMHQLVTTADVKKNYRKACIAVHPDKHIGTPQEKIAKLIFVELNNAWSEFEKESS